MQWRMLVKVDLVKVGLVKVGSLGVLSPVFNISTDESFRGKDFFKKQTVNHFSLKLSA